MKLFTEAGSSANIGVVLYRTALHYEKSNRAFWTAVSVFIGILLGEYLGKIIGLKIPTLLLIACELLIVAFQAVLIIRRVYRKQQIIMEFSSERDAGSFQICPNQILWVSPMGDIPVFDHRGYKVKQVNTSEGIRYICTGKTGIVMCHEMQRLMPEEKIWKCKKLIVEFGRQMEQYPEAVKILEQKEGKHREKVVC